MKTLSSLTVVVLMLTIFVGTVYADNSGATGSSDSQRQSQTQAKNNQNQDPKYAAYKIDGFATASKLAAQRSHTVSGEDERKFAIFTGITVILIIYFFTQFKFFDP